MAVIAGPAMDKRRVRHVAGHADPQAQVAGLGRADGKAGRLSDEGAVAHHAVIDQPARAHSLLVMRACPGAGVRATGPAGAGFLRRPGEDDIIDRNDAGVLQGPDCIELRDEMDLCVYQPLADQQIVLSPGPTKPQLLLGLP